MSRLGRARGLIGGEWRLAVPTSTVAIIGVMVLLIVGAIGAMVRTAGHEDEDVVTQLTPPPSGSFAPVPEFRHAYVIVFENKSLEQFLASPDQAPTFFALRHRYASFDAYQGIAHPSQPNYLAMIAGSTLGIHGNEPKDVAGTTILDQLETSGRDWRVYAENMPPGCFAGTFASGGRDGGGTYARKHDPAISIDSVRESPARCAKIQDLTSFDPAAADLEIIIPNLCHDAHDCALPSADAWLKGFLPGLMASPAYRDGGVIFTLFEESDGTASNVVPSMVISNDVKPGATSLVPHNHYSLLRTLQQSWGLPCLAASCQANTLGEVFKP
jgi:acid phosphatase